jgi:hypothetical protein
MKCPMCDGTGKSASRFSSFCLTCGGSGLLAKPSVDDSIRDSSKKERHWQDLLTQLDDDHSTNPDGDWAELPEHELMGVLINLTTRRLAVSFALSNGELSPDHVAELNQIIGDFERVLQATRPTNLSVTEKRVEQELSDSRQLLAACSSAIDDVSGGQDLGMFAQSDDRVGRSRTDTDALLREHRRRVAAAESDLDRAAELLGLAELHHEGEDAHDAARYYREAEDILSPLIPQISGSSTAQALIDLMSGTGSPDSMGDNIRIRKYLRRTYTGLCDVLESGDGGNYKQLLADLDGSIADGNEDNVEFSKLMLGFLEEEEQKRTDSDGRY